MFRLADSLLAFLQRFRLLHIMYVFHTLALLAFLLCFHLLAYRPKPISLLVHAYMHTHDTHTYMHVPIMLSMCSRVSFL